MQELVMRMANASSLIELKQSMIWYFAKEGITSLAMTLYREHTKTGSEIVYDWVSSPLEPWHKYYLEQKYADIDRTLENSEHSLIPVYWDVHTQLTQAKNARERRMRQESIEFGIDKGLCIPVHGPKNHLMVLVLHQRTKQNGLEFWQKKQFLWMAVAQYYLHFLGKLMSTSQDQGATRLTKREEQCLRLTAQGIRLENIAKTLGISERTCHFHLQNANKKLGVSNKYLAIARWQDMTKSK